MEENLQHLKLLSTFHCVVGGLAAFFACIPVVYLILGIAIVVAAKKSGGGSESPPEIMGWVCGLLGGLFVILGWSFAACVITAGRFLSRRSHYLFCLVMGGVECIFMPFGTVLGAFTIVFLSKPSVKGLFDAAAGDGTSAP